MKADNYNIQYRIYDTKGRMAWLYNPFRNYRLSKARFKIIHTINELEYIYYSEISSTESGILTALQNIIAEEYFDSSKYKLIYTNSDDLIKDIDVNAENFPKYKPESISILEGYYDESGKWIVSSDTNDKEQLVLIYQSKYQLVEFDTEELDFQITNPVSIIAQPSYDGSVNLILNDGINVPRLINSRFSATGNDTYEIIDRKGNDDTNIYDLGIQFDIDTSLYKLLDKIPIINFKSITTGGRMPVGNYHFYFKLMDADGNESDFIGQSLLVSVFIGTGTKSVQTGLRDQDSHKMVKFTITNMDTAYPYVSVYYSRTSAEGLEYAIPVYKHVLKKYLITNAGTSSILITGFEELEDVSERDINTTYNIVDRVKTHTLNLNRLFLGNVHKTDIPYDLLTNLSLLFCATVTKEPYTTIDKNYTISSSNKGYYDPTNVYNKVGYWPNEFYRFGIVYIMKSGELSPVFNIRGALDIRTDTKYKFHPIYESEESEDIHVLNYDESTYILSDDSLGLYSETSKISTKEQSITVSSSSENVKGVVKLHRALDTDGQFNILGIKISLPEYYEKRKNSDNSEYTEKQSDIVISELSQYVKGFFFVRLKRLPTVLCQGLAIGTDNNSYVPVIPVNNNIGVMRTALSNKDKLHLVYNYDEQDPENSLNYITEGFLRRYTFKFKKKSSSLWSKIGSIALVAVGVACVAASIIFTAGGSAAVVAGILGASAAGALGAVATSLVGLTIILAASAAVAATVVTVVVAGVLTVTLAMKRIGVSLIFNGWDTTAPSGYKIVEDTSKSRLLGGSFSDRIIVKNPDLVTPNALLCPDYVVDLAHYNSILVGDEHTLVPDQVLPNKNYFLNSNTRHFYVDSYKTESDKLESIDGSPIVGVYETITSNIVGVPEGTSIVGSLDAKFRSKAGEAEEACKYEAVGNEYKKANPSDSDSKDNVNAELANRKINSDIVRGIFGSYVGSTEELNPMYIYNIMVAGYSESNFQEYLQVRAEDNSEFYCISKRFDINDYVVNHNIITLNTNTFSETLYSGDCYICQFTQRLIRNFNSPALPYNDEILEESTWVDNYDPTDKSQLALINLSDVNAVLLGMWVTFQLRSSKNLNVRTIDESYIDEAALSGHPRTYFPFSPMSTEGGYKLSESLVYNKGFEESVGHQYQYELPDVPWIKNWFGTRIMYSDLHVTDAFKNGYRIFRPTNYRDYTREYGTITKLLSIGNYIIAVMEHGILRLAILPNNVTVDSAINYKNVLPENPDVISSDYGSEWIDSIIQTPEGIYGVDTHAKKIWRTDGVKLELISEGSILRFLNENLKLKERDKTVILGRRNVKTIYNQFKKDVMFTFYNINDYDEIAWNLCYSEELKQFVTFYSWIPSFMENINNIPFSFDRETSRMFSLLYNDENSLITVNSPIYTLSKLEDDVYTTNIKLSLNSLIGSTCEFEIDTSQRMGKYFMLNKENVLLTTKKLDPGIINVPVKLTLKSTYDRTNAANPYLLTSIVETEYNIIIPIVDKETYDSTSVEFWAHGLAGIIDKKLKILPTTWYGNTHPFEFEFVVADNLQYLKIFDNLQIIANKALPESFHYEIVGECYDFSKDKINMYYRLEALKYLYSYNGANISYNSNYLDLKDKLSRNFKSADFPKTYYARLDKINQIYHDYVSPNTSQSLENLSAYSSYKNKQSSYNYDHLSGAEIVYYELENEYRVWQHAKAVNLNDLSQDSARSLTAANCKYLEDKWVVTINPLIICYKNESDEDWVDDEPPVAIYNSPFPEGMETNYIPDEIKNVDVKSWLDDDSIYNTSFGLGLNRKESDIRGRYIKIRIRYSGKELAIIDFINTIYRISYA